MTACQKLKAEIIAKAHAAGDVPDGLSLDDIDAAYDELMESDCIQECELEFREGTVETGIEVPYGPLCRYYESKSVARQMSDGSWVGWTYWFGGGKHGDPDAIEWMQDAYYLDVTETEKLVVVREFKKKDDAP